MADGFRQEVETYTNINQAFKQNITQFLYYVI
jgi:hypothetical protein